MPLARTIVFDKVPCAFTQSLEHHMMFELLKGEIVTQHQIVTLEIILL